MMFGCEGSRSTNAAGGLRPCSALEDVTSPPPVEDTSVQQRNCKLH